jgi:hypothetical protein
LHVYQQQFCSPRVPRLPPYVLYGSLESSMIYNVVLQRPVALVITNILWISLRCNNLFTLMCVSSYLALHVSATAIFRCYSLVLSLNYCAVMLYLILSLIMRMLYLFKIVNIK